MRNLINLVSLTEDANCQHHWLRDANSDTVYCTDCHETIEDTDAETPQEIADAAENERVRNIEKAVQQFCEKEVGFSFGGTTYQITFDADENDLRIQPDDEEATLEQLLKLRIMGDLTVCASSSYSLNITIKTPPGFNIRPA